MALHTCLMYRNMEEHACPNCGAPQSHDYDGDYVYDCRSTSIYGEKLYAMTDACDYASGLRAAYEREKQARLRLSEQNADLQAERDRYRAALRDIANPAYPCVAIDVAREALSNSNESND